MTTLEYIKYIDYNFIRGYAYEQYVLASLHKMYDIKEAYLWKNVPYKLFTEASIIIEDKSSERNTRFKFLLDTGIDIIAKLRNNDILLVQCKCYQHRCISQKNLGGFYRILLDTMMYNKINKKKTNVIGLIAHNNVLSDIITGSYCYKQGIVQEVYIPFDTDPNAQSMIQNKLKRYKDIVFMINCIFMIFNLLCFTCSNM
jgi:predicted helicase